MPIDIEKLAKEIGKQKLSVMRPSMSGHQQMLLDGFDFTKSELKKFAEAYAAKVHDKRVVELKVRLGDVTQKYQEEINDLQEKLEDKEREINDAKIVNGKLFEQQNRLIEANA